MKKILVINVNWLGDVLFSTPALKALRQESPDAYIACLVVLRCEEVLKNNPVVNEIIVYDEYGRHRSIWNKLKFVRFLRKKKFDEVYILHPSLKRAMIGWLAGIPKRIGYDTKRRSFLLTHAVPAPEEKLHKIDYFLCLLRNCGIQAKERICEFYISREDEKTAVDILKRENILENETFVIINPGGNWSLKRWPAEYFAQLADLLIEQRGVKVLIAGSRKDRMLAKKISSRMKNEPIILSGQMTLSQLAALMSSASCVVSADSGPMHISSAVGANTVAIFGPTCATLTGPTGKGKVTILQKDIGCEIPCYKLNCNDNRCMKAISAQEVCAAVAKFVKKVDKD